MSATRWQLAAVGLGGVVVGLGLATWNGGVAGPLTTRAAGAQDVPSSPTLPPVALPQLAEPETLDAAPSAAPVRQDEPLPAPVSPPPAAPENLPAAGPIDDPEGTAVAFLDRSRKEAQGAVGALKAEVQTLRARLEKAEAGLARWQAVLDALDSQANAPRPPGWRGEGQPVPVAP
jgi:hypothetical protein